MGIFADILGSFFESKPSFGLLKVDDMESLVRADHEVDQAERKDPTTLTAALAKYGFKTKDAFDAGFHLALRPYEGHADFGTRYAEIQMKIQMEKISNVYEMPASESAPVHGVGLARYAFVRASIEHGGLANMDATLRKLDLDRARWSEIDREWERRMGPTADAMSSGIHRSNYNQYYLSATSGLRGS